MLKAKYLENTVNHQGKIKLAMVVYSGVFVSLTFFSTYIST